MCVFLQWFFFKKTSVCRQDDFQPKAKISQLQKHVVSAAIEKERQSLIIDTGTLAEKKTGSGSFFFFHQKSFCFLFRDFCQTVEKTKKRIVSALDLIITSERSRSKNNTHTFFSSPLLVFPRRRHIPLLKITNLSLWCTLSSHEAFFLWW